MIDVTSRWGARPLRGRSRWPGRAGIVLGLACAAMLGPGCGDAIDCPLATVCCEDFAPGRSMSATDWGLEGAENVRFGTLLEGIGDVSLASTAALSELATACEALVLAMGEPPPPMAGDQSFDTTARAQLFCGLAAAALRTLDAHGDLTISFEAARCAIDPDAQATCEARCAADAACDIELADVTARCPADELRGTCIAVCTGLCQGTPGAPVTCRGTCGGDCRGICDGECAFLDDQGRCNGPCDGTCDGTCSTGCTVEGDEGNCGGACAGTCSVPLLAATCGVELSPPDTLGQRECAGSAACTSGCRASAAARSSCAPPTVQIEVGGAIDAAVTAKMRAIETHLPRIVAASGSRSALLLGNVARVSELARAMSVPEQLEAGLKTPGAGATCLAPAMRAAEAARLRLETSIAASGDVLAAASGG